MLALAFHLGLSLVSLGVLYPMLRAPSVLRQFVVPDVIADVPLTTYDHRGLY